MTIVLQQGDVLVQHDNTWWTQVAKLLANQPYPHAIIIDNPEKLLVWQSIYNGVGASTMTMEDVLARFEIWRPNTTPEVKKAALALIRTNAHRLYGYANLLIVLAMYKLRVTKRPNFLKEDGDEGYICSQLIAEGYAKAGYDLVPELDDEDTKPWDLRNPKTMTRIY